MPEKAVHMYGSERRRIGEALFRMVSISLGVQYVRLSVEALVTASSSRKRCERPRSLRSLGFRHPRLFGSDFLKSRVRGRTFICHHMCKIGVVYLGQLRKTDRCSCGTIVICGVAFGKADTTAQRWLGAESAGSFQFGRIADMLATGTIVRDERLRSLRVHRFVRPFMRESKGRFSSFERRRRTLAIAKAARQVNRSGQRSCLD